MTTQVINIIDAITFNFYLLNCNNNILVIINICFLLNLIRATVIVSGLILTLMNFVNANVCAFNSVFVCMNNSVYCIVFATAGARRAEVISL